MVIGAWVLQRLICKCSDCSCHVSLYRGSWFTWWTYSVLHLVIVYYLGGEDLGCRHQLLQPILTISICTLQAGTIFNIDISNKERPESTSSYRTGGVYSAKSRYLSVTLLTTNKPTGKLANTKTKEACAIVQYHSQAMVKYTNSKEKKKALRKLTVDNEPKKKELPRYQKNEPVREGKGDEDDAQRGDISGDDEENPNKADGLADMMAKILGQSIGTKKVCSYLSVSSCTISCKQWHTLTDTNSCETQDQHHERNWGG